MDTISDMFARGTQRLIHDSNYVAYVFKRTEKICNAVYFIISNETDISNGHKGHQSDIVREVEASALELLKRVQTTLSHTVDELPKIAPSLSIAILDLSAKLGFLAATGWLNREHLTVFNDELDALERAIYFHEPDRAFPMRQPKPKQHTIAEARILAPKNEPRKPAQKNKEKKPITHHNTESLAIKDVQRVDIIKDILMKSLNVSIKDIALLFPDVSEKTIQRELNLMIDKGVVRKDGKKRWSRYSLI